MGQNARGTRRVIPQIDGLETRRLLDGKIRLVKNGALVSDDEFERAVLQRTQNVPVKDRRIAYTTDDGTKVVVTLYGKGTLKGTRVRDDGALDLVFDNTNNETRIIAAAKGPKHRNTEIPLAGIRDADTAPRNNSATGVDPVAAVQMRDFRLVDGGFINLMGGVLDLNLKAMGRRASIYLLEGVAPETTTTNSVIATGGASIGGVTNIDSVTVTSTTDATSGIMIRINRIDAGPTQTPPFGNPQVYAVDPVAGTLIRFDTTTGDPTLSVPIPGLTDATPPVGLANRGHELLVLVGNGQEVQAFNAVTGAAVGSFSTANASGLGFNEVDGIGSNSTRTILTDTGGVALHVDVAASLASGQAVVLGNAFTPQREFVLNGDATGIAGVSALFANGAAHFDSFQPNLFQFGVMTIANAGPGFAEQSRTAITPFQNAGPDGLNPNPSFGFGSIDALLAQLGTAANGKNFITLRNPTNQAFSGAVTLNYAPQLSGLSESLHPELANSSLIDISGDLTRFVGKQVHGLVINTRGSVNLIAAHTAVDSAFIGRPLNHAEFVRRENVQLISTARGANGKIRRNEVTIDKTLAPTGPLVIP